jgi:hypothetical protein
LHPAFLDVQLQKGLVKWTAVTEIPWSIIIFTASELSSPPDRRAMAFLFIFLRALTLTPLCRLAALPDFAVTDYLRIAESQSAIEEAKTSHRRQIFIFLAQLS